MCRNPPMIEVGVLDTGVDGEHIALRDHVGHFFAVNSQGSVAELPCAYDVADHGTHIAGILCGLSGNKDDSSELEIKLTVVSVKKHGKILLNLLAGMEALMDVPLKLICMPWGIPYPSPLFLEMMEAFRKKGILVVTSAGNQGKGKVGVPGLYPNVLTVGAVDSLGNIPKFSGSWSDSEGKYSKPEIFAQGVNIRSTAPGDRFKTMSGTSMACAHVSRQAAELFHKFPNASARDIRQKLLKLNSFQESCDWPDWLAQPYLDPRLLNQCRRSSPEKKIEALIGAKPIQQVLDRMQWGRRNGSEVLHFFREAEIAHVAAIPAFYEELIKQIDLQIASAVDVNIFDLK